MTVILPIGYTSHRKRIQEEIGPAHLQSQNTSHDRRGHPGPTFWESQWAGNRLKKVTERLATVGEFHSQTDSASR